MIGFIGLPELSLDVVNFWVLYFGMAFLDPILRPLGDGQFLAKHVTKSDTNPQIDGPREPGWLAKVVKLTGQGSQIDWRRESN